MEPKPPPRLKLGDPIPGTIQKASGGRRFLVKTNAAPRGWKVELHARDPDMIDVGTQGTFWVAKVAPLQGEILVHEGEFGRLPVSEAMAPRYMTALKSLVGEAEPTADALADAKAMFQKIGKRQQADWLTVWRILGEPTSTERKSLIAAIDAVRESRKDAPETAAVRLKELREQFEEGLRWSIRRLEKAMERRGQ